MNLQRKKITVRGKSGKTFQRSVMVRSIAPTTRVRSITLKSDTGKLMIQDHLRAYKNHAAMNVGLGVTDTGILFKAARNKDKPNIKKYGRHVAEDAYYAVVPPQWSGHSHADIHEMKHGTIREWYRKGRTSF